MLNLMIDFHPLPRQREREREREKQPAMEVEIKVHIPLGKDHISPLPVQNFR